MKRKLALAIGALGLVSCGNARSERQSAARAQMLAYSVPAVPAARQQQVKGIESVPAMIPAPDVRLVADRGAAVRLDVGGRLLIRTAELTLRVDTLDRALARLRDVATTLGAFVSSSSADEGDREHRTASIELRVQADRFDRAIEGLRRLGVEETQRVHTQDVGEEYVDVAARVANGRRLEARLLALLATRAGKLADIVAVEHELADVREEIDALEGRRRYLESHATLSTITVTLHEPVTLVGVAGPGVMQQALEHSWENFVWLAAVAIQSLGVVVPLGLLAGLGWSLMRRWKATA